MVHVHAASVWVTATFLIHVVDNFSLGESNWAFIPFCFGRSTQRGVVGLALFICLKQQAPQLEGVNCPAHPLSSPYAYSLSCLVSHSQPDFCFHRLVEEAPGTRRRRGKTAQHHRVLLHKMGDLELLLPPFSAVLCWL